MRKWLLRWIIKDFIQSWKWDQVIDVFVEEYKKQYNEENDPSVYFSIMDEVKRNLPHAPKH